MIGPKNSEAAGQYSGIRAGEPPPWADPEAPAAVSACPSSIAIVGFPGNLRSPVVGFFDRALLERAKPASGTREPSGVVRATAPRSGGWRGGRRLRVEASWVPSSVSGSLESVRPAPLRGGACMWIGRTCRPTHGQSAGSPSWPTAYRYDQSSGPCHPV